MDGKSEIAVEVRALGSGDAPKVRNPAPPVHFCGVLAQVRGTRLTVLTPLAPSATRCGTLVQVETPDHIYLGEIKYCVEGKVFIDFEHQLEKAALQAIRAAWS